MTIVVVSGCRADVGALEPVAEALKAEWVFLPPPEEANDSSGYISAVTAAESMMVAADNYEDLKPELVVLVGDRYEILGAAMAAHLMNIPIAHLSGGDVTEGSQDNSMRNAITNLAHLHFPTCQTSADRILAMGEEKWRIHPVGCPGIDSLLDTVLLGREATFSALKMEGPYYLIAFQPATLSASPVDEARELLKALDTLQMPCVFTTVNSDASSAEINSLFKGFCTDKHVMLEMDRKLFLSAMKYCRLMIGNSSSGLYEAPTLQKAFVNIGVRQKGRLKAASVVDCVPKADEIVKAVMYASNLDCSKVVNPYGDGQAAQRIATVIKTLPVEKQRLLEKRTVCSAAQMGTGSLVQSMGSLS